MEVGNGICGTCRSLDIRLTNIKGIDVNTIAMSRFGIFSQFANWRLRHTLCTFRNIHSCSIYQFAAKILKILYICKNLMYSCEIFATFLSYHHKFSYSITLVIETIKKKKVLISKFLLFFTIPLFISKNCCNFAEILI